MLSLKYVKQKSACLNFPFGWVAITPGKEKIRSRIWAATAIVERKV